jgi:hypothetical protein
MKIWEYINNMRLIDKHTKNRKNQTLKKQQNGMNYYILLSMLKLNIKRLNFPIKSWIKKQDPQNLLFVRNTSNWQKQTSSFGGKVKKIFQENQTQSRQD